MFRKSAHGLLIGKPSVGHQLFYQQSLRYMRALGQYSHLLCRFFWRHLPKLCTVDQDLSPLWPEYPRRCFDHSGFSASVCPHYNGNLSSRDIQVQFWNHNRVFICSGDIPKLNCLFFHFLSLPFFHQQIQEIGYPDQRDHNACGYFQRRKQVPCECIRAEH